MSSGIQACCHCPDPVSDIQALLEALHISSDYLCYVLTFSGCGVDMSCPADQHRLGSMLEGTKLEDVCQPQEVFFLEHHWTVSRALEASYRCPAAAWGSEYMSGCGLLQLPGRGACKAVAGPAWVVVYLASLCRHA